MSPSPRTPAFLGSTPSRYVIEPMQGHHNLSPVLIPVGERCVLGSGNGATIPLGVPGVQAAHCCLISNERGLFLERAVAATWVNDRLVSAGQPLMPNDRLALGPVEYRVRLASREEVVRSGGGDRRTDAPVLSAGADEGNSVARLQSLLERLTASDRQETDLLFTKVQATLQSLQTREAELKIREADAEEALRRMREELLRQENDLALAAAVMRQKESDLDEFQRALDEREAAQVALQSSERSAEASDDAVARAIAAHWEERLERREEALFRQSAELQAWHEKLTAREERLRVSEVRCEAKSVELSEKAILLRREEERLEVWAENVARLEQPQSHSESEANATRQELLEKAEQIKRELDELM